MNDTWQITVWGVRGSFPMPSPDYMEYGGNTVCTSLEHDGHIVVLDAGTGLASLGATLAGKSDIRRIDILLSHFHMDHLTGLYAFAPFFDPKAKICLHGGTGLKGYLSTLTGPPFWPVGIGDYPASLSFHEIAPGDTFDLEGIAVSTMAGNHPGGSILFRLEGTGKRLTCALDCETDEAAFRELAGFARESDLLIWDASFTESDLQPGWGHSTWKQGLALGRAAKVKRVLMTHYSREYTDELLRRQEALARYFTHDVLVLLTGCHSQAGQEPACIFAKEGMVITL